jgi:putative PIN family toxin of toxin-antitoxin system
MFIVLDTNCLLVSISERSKYHIVFKYILQQKIRLAYTTPILLEYQEMIGTHWHHEVALNVIRAILELPTSVPTTVYYNWGLIKADTDDNAFVDCAVAANVDYIVTNDHHFDVLNAVEFPTIKILKLEELVKMLKDNDVIKIW